MTSFFLWQLYFLNCRHNLFFLEQNEYVVGQTLSKNKKFCWQKLIFRKQNVVLDIQNLKDGFFSVSLKIFLFKNA